ncbi:MAG: ankyrin repeat domain-containing protein [Rhodospirillales bacterium]|nr:ankyrin repeat domain-containing protein [Rhodospirillales bacterium]
MHEAVRVGSAGTVAMLLDAGADLNATTNDGETPPHRAAGNGRSEAVAALRAAGATR